MGSLNRLAGGNMTENEKHFDCLIIGAGISGLDAAYHLQEHCQWASYAILERRANLGGTWDFFKYPGIRSDSDMYTFGFSWKIWKSAKPIAPAEDILHYLKEAADEQDIMKNIMFNTNITTAAWESANSRWHLVTTSGTKYSCNVLFGCSGYYSYETPYEPVFPGQEKFPGMYQEVKSVMSEEEFDKHFTPPYNPWEQRFCLAPGGDFFVPLREGKASIVTGHIDTFTEKGIKMKSGEHVDANFIISATGLTMQQNFPFSTIKVSVDGKPYKAAEHLLYNAMMVSDIPNFAFIVGYTNASWTLKADIAALYFTKLLNHMRSNNIAKVVPREGSEGAVKRENLTGGLTSGYFARSGAVMPKQGDKFPWKGGVNYLLDLIQMTFGGISKDCLEFEVDEKKHL